MISTSTRSSLPPKYPEKSPSGTPTPIEMRSDTSTTLSSVCVPQMTLREDVRRLDVRAHQMVARGRLELREALAVRLERVEVVRAR